ncbi:MAG: magnesium transporter [Candidatus Aenigmarchaeota archaeon ex4484_56]|nr:MAG: magnesium transporter [Candidatus Aenigmarchaeota archaeon ex4484_56]
MKKDKYREIIKKLLSSKDKLSVFREIPVNEQGFVLLSSSKYLQQEILNKLKNNEIVSLLHYLDPDEVTDLLQRIGKYRRKKILKNLNKEIRNKVEFLLRFAPDTAAGIMDLNYIEVDKNINFKELGKIIQKYEEKTGKVPAILAVEDGFLVGELPVHSIAIGKSNEKISKYITKVPCINYNKDENEIIKIFRKNPHNKIVVLDDDNSILGVIYSDDILKLIEKHSTNHLRKFAGVSKEEDVFDSPLTKVKNRYKWLIINLGTAFLAASVVAFFEKTIAAYTLLAVYMPIVAGMGGNAGTQTLAVMVRGLALKEIELETSKKVIINETIAGGINGLINGSIVAIVAFLFNKNPLLGFVVGIAMIINLVIAGLFGGIVPLIMKKLGKDPASSATIFITTATDVCGFFAFLGLASLIL